MSTLPQQNTINQYVANGVQTIYNYNYLILLNTDIAVYVTPAGQLPNPLGDIKILNVDYTVTNVGNTGGGTVVFTVAPLISSIVTLARAMQETITTNFSMASTINGANLDSSFQRCMLVSQQIQSQVNTFCLQYAVDQYIPAAGQNILPPLASGQIWAGNGAGGITATTIANGTDSLLRSQLASQTMAAPGAAMVGYYNTTTNTPTTVNAALNSLASLGVIYRSTGIYDASGNLFFLFDFVSSPVNYIGFANNSTGNAPLISAAGSDTNVSLTLIGQGTGGINLKGTGTNDDASPSIVGEFKSSTILSASAMTMASNAATNLTSISLTAGDWDVWGNISFLTGGSSPTNVQGWLSSTSATAPDLAYRSSVSASSISNNNQFAVPQQRFSLAATTTVYISGYLSNSSGTGTTCGGIYARRVR